MTAAESRANSALKAHLKLRQRIRWAIFRSIRLQGGHTGVTYIITSNWRSLRVPLVIARRRFKRCRFGFWVTSPRLYGRHADRSLPLADHVLALKCVLEGDEKMFWRGACKYGNLDLRHWIADQVYAS